MEIKSLSSNSHTLRKTLSLIVNASMAHEGKFIGDSVIYSVPGSNSYMLLSQHQFDELENKSRTSVDCFGVVSENGRTITMIPNGGKNYG